MIYLADCSTLVSVYSEALILMAISNATSREKKINFGMNVDH